jgi:hypothetical protein
MIESTIHLESEVFQALVQFVQRPKWAGEEDDNNKNIKGA